MIIDSPIISGSYLSTGSLSQTGNVSITGSLTATAGITGSFSGSGADLFGIPATGITGLNLSQISSGSVSASISPNQGLLINTSVSASNFSGSFSGSGADLFGIPATAITGLNLSQISSGSVSASISPNQGLLINTSVSASNFTGSFTGSLTGIATSASYASFALTSSYSLGGSGFPFSGSAVITGSLIVSGSGLTITGSVAISSLTTGSGVRYVIADADGLLSAQTASAAIFTTQQVVSTANQTTFPITNGYSTGYVTVFVNGTKLSADEYVDTSGTNIIFLTGSTAGDVVEFQKYLPAAGVSNNTLRTVNYFTATLGQTDFTVNYTPGLLDVFYNGAKLDNTEYTAANGTSITLATGSNAGDRLEVDVYSYQVGAFSGIGGTGAANQLAYFNTSNSITGSNAFTVSGSAIIITGSLIVSGSGTLINIGPTVFSGSVTSTAGFSGSFSGNADSASLAQNSLLLQGTGSIGFATTASLLAVSSSQQQISSSLLNVIANYATTGSNSFRADQSITGSLVVSSTITAQTLVVQTVTSSIVYSSGSNIFGSALGDRQTFTGSVNITGSQYIFGNVGIGTNSPRIAATGANKTLDIKGGIYFGDTNSESCTINNNDSMIFNIDADNSSTSNFFRFATNTTQETGGTELVRITEFGNVGIGTSNPTGSLDVSGSVYIRSTGGGVLYIPRMADQSRGLSIGEQTALGSKSAVIRTAGGVSEHLFLDPGFNNSDVAGNIALAYANTGSVGIGTYLPDTLLTAVGKNGNLAKFKTNNSTDSYNAGIILAGNANSVQASRNAYILLDPNGANGTGQDYAFFTALGSGETQFGTSKSDGFLALYTADTERMRISSAGSVIVGNAAYQGTTTDLSITGDKVNSNGYYSRLIFQNSNQSGGSSASIRGERALSNYATELTFYTNINTSAGEGLERMRIAYNGNVGIATTSPAKPLSVWPSGGIGVYSNNTYSPSISLDFNSGTNIGHLLADQNAYYIRTLTSYPIYVQANQANGVYLSVGATSWTGNSDERLKNITGNIENAIDSLLTLRTIKHTWKSDNTNKQHLALIAQDVEKVFPEIIDSLKLPSKVGEEQTDETEYLGVRYTELIPVLVKAIQELQEKLQRNNIN